MADSHPRFVRPPRAAAERLESAAEQTATSKREIRRLVAGEDLLLGTHPFRQADAPAVLTFYETAELLRVEPGVVRELADSGELPARPVGNEWRFSRETVLAWLGG